MGLLIPIVSPFTNL